MSVEEARRTKREQHEYCDQWACCYDDDFLDRLILEVQAGMPCYWTEGECAQTPCPSCQAREKLKETA